MWFRTEDGTRCVSVMVCGLRGREEWHWCVCWGGGAVKGRGGVGEWVMTGGWCDSVQVRWGEGRFTEVDVLKLAGM